MENGSPEFKQAEEAVNSAFSEKIVTQDSKDVGRVIDPEYAKHLANIEDKVRTANPEMKSLEEYSNYRANEEIVNNMTAIAARKISLNQGERYTDANKMLANEGINPVNRNMANRKLKEVLEMQKAEDLRREYKESRRKK